MSKNMLNQVNDRLKMVYNMIPPCRCIGDVGTDHGFLPIYCVQTGKCPSAVASDISEGPLKVAKKNILLYDCAQQIQTLQCPGLEAYPDEQCDVIVIAGMGGFTIRRILEDRMARRGYFPGNILLILQPNTAEQELRKYLWDHAFTISDERAVRDGKHVYAAFKCYYTGIKEEYQKIDCYTGKVMGRRYDANDKVYFEALLKKYANVLKGLAGKRDEDGAADKRKICIQVAEKAKIILNGECRDES